MRESQDRQGEGDVLGSLGDIALQQGQLEASQRYHEQALAIHHEVQDLRGVAVDLFSLGQVLEAQGNYPTAALSFEEAMTAMREIGDNINYPEGALQLGALLITQLDQKERGCALLAEAIRIREELGLPGAEEARETARQLGCG